MNPHSSEPISKKRRLSNGREDNDQLEVDPAQVQTQSSGETVERGDPWMEDGTLTIQAGQVKFRVHRSIISHCSSVFSDMFSLPQPQNHDMQPVSDATEEDNEVVHVHDSAGEMGYLLKAIYENAYSADPRTKAAPMDFAKASALLRLGNKYDIPGIRDNIIRRFQAQYSSSYNNMSFGHRYIALHNTDEKRIHFDIINFFYKEQLYSCLPMAFYDAINTCDTKTILKHLHDDGAKLEHASSMLSTCILGKEKLANEMCTVGYTWLKKRRPTDIMNPTCSSEQVCTGLFFKLEKRIFNPAPFLSYALKYDVGQFLASVERGERVFCSGCAERVRISHEEAREQMFEELPSILELGTWQELKQMDRCQLEDEA